MRARILAALLLVSPLLAFAQTAGDWYIGKPIKDVTFEGLKHVKETELEGVVEPFIGRLFNDDLFWDLQGRLYALEYFDLIAPSAVPADQAGTAVILKFVVTEKPVISRIEFEGNSGLRKNELLDLVTVKPNDVANSLKLRLDEQAIRDKYLERGYPDVTVRAETRTLSDASLSVAFVIDEGEKLAIDGFVFEGNIAFSERTLRGLLSLKAKSLLEDGAFQDSKLLADRDAIASYYRERGYVDAAVTDVGRETSKDSKGNNLMTLTFKIREGRQYSFGGLSFEGNKIFPVEQLSALVYSKPGQTLNAKKLEADFQRVADLYYENGYIFNTINRKESRNEDSLSIAYVISIVERGRAHIENIIIRGNVKTKESVILREIPLETGDIFSKAKVLDGLRNLYNLQYFSAVTPETPQGSADNLMDLVFNVEEQPTADIQFGITFSGLSTPGAFPISGLIKWNDRNFLGNGNTFGVELNAAPDTQKLVFQFNERWLLGLPLSGGFDLTMGHTSLKAAQDVAGPIFNGDEDEAFPDPYSSYEEYYDAGKTIPDAYLMAYDQWTVSLGFSSGYRFPTPLGTFGVGGGVRTGFVRNSYDDRLYRPFDPTLREGNNEWLLSNSVWGSASLDQRDIYYDPSKGYYLSQRASWVGVLPWEKERYIRTDTKGEFYFTLFNLPLSDVFSLKTVFGAHTGVSMIHSQFNGDPVIESSNMLAIDGMFVARGWYSLRSDLGLAMWESWAELRTPLAPGVLALDWFLDAAAVKETPEALFTSLTMSDFYYSMGAGLRFTIPQFPFRFSLVKRFTMDESGIQWMPGSIWRDSADSNSGLDFVLSFAISTY
ncbi:MAG: outer membrane protein assembly factor BamA [Treponema sp. GWB1_62_6]|nr:MAG: outer membrane protein assembly factor BamA [Treponema sp. GWB1_62_6]OHE67435.1 MAG: outer membrane protein assembly factor BamA [Treponema sp. GWC1_61_84]OHE76771.1 MAG: outer membrane protein assembly factor BamA [Treponema sp. RIFOXYC1_FULL_61_9]HCM28375.1 outer membrane protein assembly factor BamA [Treponema sp.]